MKTYWFYVTIDFPDFILFEIFGKEINSCNYIIY